MELRQLRYFAAVARRGNFTRAAEELHLAQSALSQQVRRLERELGVELLLRTTRRVELTDAGEIAGSLALTEEDDGPAKIRWFLLAPSLRGQGLGRRLLTELVAEADEAGHERLCLVTFSDLRSAARLYRSLGFEITDSYRDGRWGRPLLLQRYERRRP